MLTCIEPSLREHGQQWQRCRPIQDTIPLVLYSSTQQALTVPSLMPLNHPLSIAQSLYPR